CLYVFHNFAISGSVDDDKIVAFKWTQDKGPSIPLGAMNTPILTLDNMVAGSYVFSVQVTDSGGLTSSASTRVEIEAERDDPPKAHINECGSKEHTGSLTVRLPLPELNLCGNSSIDDKGIVSYNWFRVDKLSEKLSVDTAGSTTSILTLKNIQANERLGPYEFQLDVTDTKGQKDSTRISIFVNKAENFPPVADAGGNHTVILPENAIVLDGNAKDDGSIVSYNWTQIEYALSSLSILLNFHTPYFSGPSRASLVNADKAKATASRLQEGVYRFLLTVVDDGGLNGTASAYITVERSKNEPPVARAPNVTVHLPTSVAVLNASSSSDDAGIVSFHWQPLDDVPASMIALDGTENTQIMFITGLVKGTHVYNLTVADQQKARNSILVYLTVIEGEEELESVEILLKKSIEEWTYRLRRKLRDRIEASLAGSIEVRKCGNYFISVLFSSCLQQDVAAHFSPREIFLFNRIEESDELETGIREFMRAIYFVLESKRVDQSFEKLECPPCPALPEEEKFRVGVENKTSKMYKRKCVGRSRKQNADYAMLTGLPQLALDSYAASMELLKSSNDMLWYAGLFITKYDYFASTSVKDGACCCDVTFIMNSLSFDVHSMVSLGHQRHRSDENARVPVTDDGSDGSEGRRSRMPWAVLRGERSKDKIEPAAILEKFEQALEYYSKFSFAAVIEYDCMMKAVSLYRYQRLYVEMEVRLTYLPSITLAVNTRDDSFTRFDNHTKAAICSNSAALYREIGFRRKCSFFARGRGPKLLMVNTGPLKTTELCIQSFTGLISILAAPVKLKRNLQCKNLSGISSLFMVFFKMQAWARNVVLGDPILCPLPPHLAPTVIPAKAGQPQLFIYSPFQQKKASNEIYWVVDCAGEVSILVYNCRPYELVVRELCLLADGCVFESVPVRLILPAANEGAPARIKLIGVPRTPGLLTITGYCCEVFGVKNVCKLFGQRPLKVEVLPSLAVLQLESSLPRAPIEEDLNDRSTEITVYSGQLFARLPDVMTSFKVSGGPSMIELSSQTDDESFSLAPLEEKEIKFRIFGIDPTATADDEGSEERIVETVLPLASTMVELPPDSEAHDLIPYTGRLPHLVEKLRATLELHVAKHLDIRWAIPAMNLEGLVPVGALLSSVSLLKQLVLPAISLDISVNGVPYLSEDDISIPHVSISSPRCELSFHVMFRVEGVHKIRPQIVSRRANESLFSDEIFVSPVGFSVSTKAHQ
ncbi:hypothetical protein OSTOST_19665, partial [Ostertagia ostertagi]